MAMTLRTGDDGDDDELVSSINTTPLVDVMLVLLIIFLITIPVVTHSVTVALPHEANQPTLAKPQTIVVAVDRDGDFFWNDTRLADADHAAGKAEAARDRAAAAGGADPRRQGRALRLRRAHRRRLPARRHRQGRLHHRARARRRRCRRRVSAHGIRPRPQRRAHDRHQHHAAHRRDAGAADHADRHHSGADAFGQARHAAGQSAAGDGAA